MKGRKKGREEERKEGREGWRKEVILESLLFLTICI
jgi:hypothetical protein